MVAPCGYITVKIIALADTCVQVDIGSVWNTSCRMCNFKSKKCLNKKNYSPKICTVCKKKLTYHPKIFYV